MPEHAARSLPAGEGLIARFDSFHGRPYARVGDGPQHIVIVSGGDAFVRRFDVKNADRNARRIARIFPAASLFILGYDPTASCDAEELVASTAEFLRETGPAVLVGISFGGFIALRVAAKHPELVRALILVSSAPRFSTSGRARIAQQIADLERGDYEGMARPFIALFRRRRLNLAVRFALWLRRRSMAARLNDPQYVIAMLKTALQCSDAPMSPAAQTPTLVVIGERDQFFDAASVAGAVTFPRETHMLAIEQPEAVKRTIAAFLNRLQS
jgi:pimeloyl-ACP methyl ester carboxylesterase